MFPRADLHDSYTDAEYGSLDYTGPFHSALLGDDRQLVVYLPPGYDEDASRRCPVLYMQDGQNLFDGRTTFVPGQHWHLNETADNLIREGALEPTIIVGVYNAGARRVEEYTPTFDPSFGAGGRADLAGRMLAEELKPYVDASYRTKPGREHTGIGGSSLGGLVSLYVGLVRAETFGRVIAMSPSLWWDDCWLLRNLDSVARGPRAKVWLDAGTSEGAHTACHAEALADALAARGYEPGEDVEFMRAEGARHSEQDWAHRAHRGLRFAYARPGREAAIPQPFLPPGVSQAQGGGGHTAAG